MPSPLFAILLITTTAVKFEFSCAQCVQNANVVQAVFTPPESNYSPDNATRALEDIYNSLIGRNTSITICDDNPTYYFHFLVTERSLDGSRLAVTAAYIAGMFQTNLGVVNDTFRMWLINFETIMFSILQPCLGPDNTTVAIDFHLFPLNTSSAEDRVKTEQFLADLERGLSTGSSRTDYQQCFSATSSLFFVCEIRYSGLCNVTAVFQHASNPSSGNSIISQFFSGRVYLLQELSHALPGIVLQQPYVFPPNQDITTTVSTTTDSTATTTDSTAITTDCPTTPPCEMPVPPWCWVVIAFLIVLVIIFIGVILLLCRHILRKKTNDHEKVGNTAKDVNEIEGFSTVVPSVEKPEAEISRKNKSAPGLDASEMSESSGRGSDTASSSSLEFPDHEGFVPTPPHVRFMPRMDVPEFNTFIPEIFFQLGGDYSRGPAVNHGSAVDVKQLQPMSPDHMISSSRNPEDYDETAHYDLELVKTLGPNGIMMPRAHGRGWVPRQPRQIFPET